MRDTLCDVDLLRPFVLGVVQGLTEFLPVSSSGHLVVVRQLFGWSDEGLSFDAALHLGTLVALLIVFRGTWWSLLRGRDLRLLKLLAFSTLPAAFAGYWGERALAGLARNGGSVGPFFLVTAAILLAAERVAARRRVERTLTAQGALLVGVAQLFALIPGVSRSGATIAAGVAAGLSRVRAVEFSFLLAAPITAAAGLAGLRHITLGEPQQLAALALGFVAALATGWAAVTFLLRTIRTRTFLPYVVYLALLGVLLIVFS